MIIRLFPRRGEPLEAPVHVYQDTSQATRKPCGDFLMGFLVEKPPQTAHFQPTRQTGVFLVREGVNRCSESPPSRRSMYHMRCSE